VENAGTENVSSLQNSAFRTDEKTQVLKK